MQHKKMLVSDYGGAVGGSHTNISIHRIASGKLKTMKNLLTFLALFMLVLCPGMALADYTTPLSNSYSSDGDEYLLYRTFNNLFGVGFVGSNNELVNAYGFKNEGALQVNAPRIYAVSSMYTDEDTFHIWGASQAQLSDMFYFNDFPHVNPTLSQHHLRDWINRPLFVDPTYSGPLNFAVYNRTGNGGQFYSNLNDHTNQVGVPGMTHADKSGVNYFLNLDVTYIMGLAYPNLGFDYTSAYLIAYEDRARSGPKNTDYDYNDGVFLVFSNNSTGPIDPPDPPDPPGPGDVPEPATLLLWALGGLGLTGSSWVRKHRLKKLALC